MESPRQRITVQFTTLAVLLVACFQTERCLAVDSDPREEYLKFVRGRAIALRAREAQSPTAEGLAAQRTEIREQLRTVWGCFTDSPGSLDPRVLGAARREGYRVERVVFKTLPGVFMTANAYVPDGTGRRPAILMVHGHWRGAKQDPVVQARCIGAAKLGFFVLAVDALGAGERGVDAELGEYHGAATGATLLPVGLPLSGLQVFENTRAIDYLRSRPEVDGKRIGVTGASGGGNQAMYVGAWDERLAASVPVCSVGNYQAYLGTACCLCEVVPGALRFTEEWGVLGLTAPRGLLVVNATRDAVQFSVPEARISLKKVGELYNLLGKADFVRHEVFESGHDYSRPMREAMYGWMTRFLKNEGDGSPIPEPEVRTEDPESLRCYPKGTRPPDWLTLPQLAAREGRRFIETTPWPADRSTLERGIQARRLALVERVLGGFPQVPSFAPQIELSADRNRLVHFEPEPGLHLTARVEPASDPSAPLAVVIDLDGAEKARSNSLAAAVRRARWTLVTLDLRATGAFTWPNDAVAGVVDHNSAEWALWLGRPLLGQWVFDIRRLIDALERSGGPRPRELVVIGAGPAGLVALAAGATDPRVTRIAAVGSLVSYLTKRPFVNQRLGVMAPGVIRHVGDVSDLASLCAPRTVVIAAPVAGDGHLLTAEEKREAYRGVSKTWQTLGHPGGLVVLESEEAAGVVGTLLPR